VQRGARVTKGQLLAELENADLAATAESSKGDYDQAQASYVLTVGSGLPQQIQKAELDAAAAKAGFEAQQRIYESRKVLLQQGAIPRRDLETAEVALAQARSQNEQAQKQLARLATDGERTAVEISAGHQRIGRRQVPQRGCAAELFQIKSPIDGVVTDRATL